MTMRQTNPKVDAFLNRSEQWREEFAKLRMIALGCDLTEELKWGVPCYTFDGKNVVLMHGFKAYCALLFIKGALLKDDEHLLIQQTENVQAGRQIRFQHVSEIEALEATLKAYIQEAIGIEASGQKVSLKSHTAYAIPEELQSQFDQNPPLKTAFAALTPGRQRAYLLYFSQPKQSKTRLSRIDKYASHILSGKGLNDE